LTAYCQDSARLAQIEKSLGYGLQCCKDNILKDKVIVELETQKSQLNIQNSILEFNHLMDSVQILTYKVSFAVCSLQKKETDAENKDLLDQLVKEAYRKRQWRTAAIVEAAVIGVAITIKMLVR
jgi:hypothetical protein